MTVLTMDGVSRRYGDVVALDGVDLEVAEGTMLALLGPNGAGKTTLVGLASGQAAPDAGTVRVCGRDPRSGRTEDRRLVGLAPQDVALYPVLSVRDNLRAFGEMSGLGAREARRRAGELAEPFRLTHLLDRRAGQLSGGEQRRLHAAAALLHRPRLVLLDEPTAGADVQTRAAILDAVRALTGDGTSVVYTTHYLPEIEQLDPEVAVIHRGRIVARGGLAQLVARHGDAAVRLDFDGPAPGDVSWPAGTVVDGSRVRVPCEEPGPALPALVTSLGSHAGRLRAVELVRPSIEAVYLALTGGGADTPRTGTETDTHTDTDTDADAADAPGTGDAIRTDGSDDGHPHGAARSGGGR